MGNLGKKPNSIHILKMQENGSLEFKSRVSKMENSVKELNSNLKIAEK